MAGPRRGAKTSLRGYPHTRVELGAALPSPLRLSSEDENRSKGRGDEREDDCGEDRGEEIWQNTLEVAVGGDFDSEGETSPPADTSIPRPAIRVRPASPQLHRPPPRLRRATDARKVALEEEALRAHRQLDKARRALEKAERQKTQVAARQRLAGLGPLGGVGSRGK